MSQIINGHRNASGKLRNKLLIFLDCTYEELFESIPRKKRGVEATKEDPIVLGEILIRKYNHLNPKSKLDLTRFARFLTWEEEGWRLKMQKKCRSCGSSETMIWEEGDDGFNN